MDLLGSVEGVDLGELCDLPLPVGPEEKGEEYRKKVLGELVTVTPEEEWKGDPRGLAWDKVCSAFLSGKDAFSIKSYARTLSEGAWLEVAQKMAPKQIEVNQFQITAVRIELPPAEGVNEGDIIEVDIPA